MINICPIEDAMQSTLGLLRALSVTQGQEHQTTLATAHPNNEEVADGATIPPESATMSTLV